MRRMSRAARPNTVTIYNYVGTTAGVATYQRTQLGRVCYDSAYQQKAAKRGVATRDKVQLLVELRDVDATDGRTFVLPKVWAALSATERAEHFTANPVNDFMVEGACDTELPPATKTSLQQNGTRAVGITETSLLGGFVLEVYGA